MLNQVRPGRNASPSDPELSPFSAGDWNRPLRLLIDDDEVEANASLELLRSLATRPSVEVYSARGSTPYEARVEQLSADDPGSWAAVRWRGEDFDRRFVNDPSIWLEAACESGAK